MQDVLDFIQSVLDEAVYVVVTEKDGRKYRSGFRPAKQTADVRPDERLGYTLSWRGKYDTDGALPVVSRTL
jgi:hypothetical protein